MSIKIMQSVWACNLPESIPTKKRSTVKIVLLKLADNANDNGKCWPSMGRIAHETDLSERSVVRCINDLKSVNLIHVKTHRKNGVKHNTYYINTPLLDSMRCEYESKSIEENDNPFTNPSDMLSNPSDMLSKKDDQMSVKPSVTIKEPSNTDVSHSDERIHVEDLDKEDFPNCIRAINRLEWLKSSAYKIFTGALTINEWSECEDAMNSVDCFDFDYFDWWMKERSKSMRKAPSLPNMLTDMNGTTLEQFYDSTFMQEWD